MTDAFQKIALLLAAAASIGALAIRLRQPLILAYIAVDILAGLGYPGRSGYYQRLQLSGA